MNLWKKSLTILALSLPLIAAKCDEQLSAIAVKTCAALDTIYSHYDQVKADGVIPVRYTSRVDAVRVQTDKLCANPAGVNTIVLAGVAGEAYIALRAAFRAGAGEGSDDYHVANGLEKLENLKVYLQKMKKE